MPATEQTWRNQKWMHVIFGITGVLMLVTTVWMLAADHDREWKPYQRKYHDIETWYAQARIDQTNTEEFADKTAEMEHAVFVAAAQTPDESIVEAFIAAAQDPPGDEDSGPELERELARVKPAYEALAQAAEPAAEPADEEEAGEAKPDVGKLMDRVALRGDLDRSMENVIARARFYEDRLFSALKAAKAILDVEKSRYSISIGEGKSSADIADIETAVQGVQTQVDDLTEQQQDAKTFRLSLEAIFAEMNQQVADAEKALADHQGDLDRLQTVKSERELTSVNWVGGVVPAPGKGFLDLPIINAFNSPLKVNQIWLPNLTLYNNFKDVARFDRCTTCHLGIDKTAPGSAVSAGYPLRTEAPLQLTLATPDEAPENIPDQTGDTSDAALWKLVSEIYGLELAPVGLMSEDEATISVVRPLTLAADALLQPGDVLFRINGVKILDRRMALSYLLEIVQWGEPLQLDVKRGVPHPYASHPRLDLYVGSLSPHKMMEMGCTICHEGQGSATAFKWASHTPNDPLQMQQWEEEHGWFNNHHWIFPMRPARFAESSCLKCHHQVTELEPSEKFPEPPAPQVTAGFHMIEDYGCFGCHEILGYAGADQNIGPDLRLEPNFSAAASEILYDGGLTDDEKKLAQELVDHPDRSAARKKLAEVLLATDESDEGDEESDESEADARLRIETVELAKLLAGDPETPGKYRKVGPSLRYVASKLDRDFLYSWIKKPADFRPSTKMPQFFSLWEHLEVDSDKAGLEESERFEPIEIRAVTEYLLDKSQPFEYLPRPDGVTEAPSAERGKTMFQTKGCLACHKHKDFPGIDETQGPELSNIGDKFAGDEHGPQWLYTWLREPMHYHARTFMPNVLLEPIAGDDGKTTDPAADIAAFLLDSREGWKPGEVPAVDGEALNDLAAMYLGASFTVRQVEGILTNGIPASMEKSTRGAERMLLGLDSMSDEQKQQQKMLYVGHRTIARLGCYGCHDIPGFEDAKPIGTGLADWGRKDPATLAFEQVVAFVGAEAAAEQGGGEHGDGHADGGHVDIHHLLDPMKMSPDEGFFMESLLHHERTGFIWQKLRAPRSFDYKLSENKPYIDRLRMPKFPFDESQREQVITFVLGLVADPPADEYVYHPDPRREAVIQGEQLLTKYNCVGCHTMDMDTWSFDYDPEEFYPPPQPPGGEYAFLKPYFTAEQLAASKVTDHRGLGHATVVGVPNPEVGEDDDGNPLYFFQLWEPTPINGDVWQTADQVPIPESDITAQHPAVGGAFARYLHPVALEMEQQTNPNAKASDAWGWVPPPLLGEGDKVQTAWTNDFLLNPYRIRPAVILRMPKFNMSEEESQQFANYFAAKSHAQYPYEFDPRTQSAYLAEKNTEHPHRLADAMKLVTSNDYCVKCHLVGDFRPEGAPAALAPNLDQVGTRLRPDFLEKWIGNPARLLPYTGMPVNFPPGEEKSQNLYHGTSEQQLQAIVDLLLNYDHYMTEQVSIKPLIQTPPAAAAPADAAAGGAGGE